MNATVKHTLINILSLIAGIAIVYLIGEAFTYQASHEQPSMSDQTFGNAAGIIGAALLTAIIGLGFLIIWSLRVIWVIRLLWDIRTAVFLNMAILLIPWSPFIIYFSWSAIHKTSDYFHRPAFIKDKECIRSIPFGNHLSLHSWTVQRDSIFIALTNTDEDAKTETHDHVQYFLLKGNQLIKTEKAKIEHLLNHNSFPFRYRNTYGPSFFAKQKDSLATKLYITEEDECCTSIAYLRSFITHEGKKTLIDSLEGFDDLDYHLYTPNFHETSAYSIDEKGNISFPLLYGHIKNQNVFEHFTIAEKKVGERIHLREIDLDCLSAQDRSVLKSGFFGNFVSRHQYIYLIMQHQIFFLTI